jgi:hypothetical protein
MADNTLAKAGITLKQIWCDGDLLEFSVSTSDGESQTIIRGYIGHDEFEQAVAAFEIFKRQVHGGLYDFRIGAFGPEFASGAFNARFHFQDAGRVYISVNIESEWREFGIKSVAHTASYYLETEPGLLDRFVEELTRIGCADEPRAFLECSNRN